MLVISISKVKPLYSVDTSPPTPTQSLKYQIRHDKLYPGFAKKQFPFRSACFQAVGLVAVGFLAELKQTLDEFLVHPG